MLSVSCGTANYWPSRRILFREPVFAGGYSASMFSFQFWSVSFHLRELLEKLVLMVDKDREALRTDPCLRTTIAEIDKRSFVVGPTATKANR